MANDSVSHLRKVQREICRTLSNVGLKSTRTNYLGMPLRVPVMYGTGRQLIVPDQRWMSRCLRRFLELKKGVVLDVGMNVGLYLVKLRALDPDRPYIGVEPNPFCNHYVHELVRLNGFANVRVLPVAFSSENRVGRLLANSRDDQGASILPDIKAGQQVHHSVDALFHRGDDLLSQLRPAGGIGVIKIDVEGAESEVIEGLRNTITTDRPFMYCEISGAFAGASQARREATARLWGLLHSLDYRVLGVLWDATLQELRELADLKEPYNGEYILAHAGDVPALMKAFESERGIPIRRRK